MSPRSVDTTDVLQVVTTQRQALPETTAPRVVEVTPRQAPEAGFADRLWTRVAAPSAEGDVEGLALGADLFPQL
jgi:hypothetical protein